MRGTQHLPAHNGSTTTTLAAGNQAKSKNCNGYYGSIPAVKQGQSLDLSSSRLSYQMDRLVPIGEHVNWNGGWRVCGQLDMLVLMPRRNPDWPRGQFPVTGDDRSEPDSRGEEIDHDTLQSEVWRHGGKKQQHNSHHVSKIHYRKSRRLGQKVETRTVWFQLYAKWSLQSGTLWNAAGCGA